MPSGKFKNRGDLATFTVHLIAGNKSRDKTLVVDGVAPESLLQALSKELE